MKNKLTEGFTLIEMLVTVSIATVIMSTVFFNYATFIDRLAISSAGQEMAIAVRQAQTYGLTVKEVTVGGGQFSAAYGIYFDLSDPTNFYLFADTNADNKYTVGSGCGSGSTECVEKFILRNNIRITGICDATTCPPVVGATRLTATFLRPTPDAVIYFANNANALVAGPSTKGKVVLTSPKGSVTNVIIDSTGQILVQKT
jgi:prepilin-type N-terminal cleavage/methylation domain-containing protein